MEQCASFLLLQHAGETGVNQSNRAINSLPFATNFSSNADLALKWCFEYCFFPILQGVSQKPCFDPLLVLWLSGRLKFQLLHMFQWFTYGIHLVEDASPAQCMDKVMRLGLED